MVWKISSLLQIPLCALWVLTPDKWGDYLASADRQGGVKDKWLHLDSDLSFSQFIHLYSSGLVLPPPRSFPRRLSFLSCYWNSDVIFALTGHFVRYSFLVSGWTFSLSVPRGTDSSSYWKPVRDFGHYWHDSNAQLMQICQQLHDVNLPLYHIPKLLNWIEIGWLIFVTWLILLESIQFNETAPNNNTKQLLHQGALYCKVKPPQ